MVTIIKSNKNAKLADVRLNIHNIYDIINGLNILVGNKENEINRHSGGDAVDKDQYERYKSLLKEMQEVKALFK